MLFIGGATARDSHVDSRGLSSTLNSRRHHRVYEFLVDRELQRALVHVDVRSLIVQPGHVCLPPGPKRSPCRGNGYDDLHMSLYPANNRNDDRHISSTPYDTQRLLTSILPRSDQMAASYTSSASKIATKDSVDVF